MPTSSNNTKNNNQQGSAVSSSSSSSTTGTTNNSTTSSTTSHPHTIPPSTMISVVEEQSNDSNMVHIMPLGPINNTTTTTTTTTNNNNNNPHFATNNHMRNESASTIPSIISESTLNNMNMNMNHSSSNNTALDTSTNTSLRTLSINPDDSLNIHNGTKTAIFKPENVDLLHKKSSVDPLLEIKLKKTTNPSMSSLRVNSTQLPILNTNVNNSSNFNASTTTNINAAFNTNTNNNNNVNGNSNNNTSSNNINNTITSNTTNTGSNFTTVSSASTTLTKGSARAEYFAAKLHDAIKGDSKKNQKDNEEETFVYGTTTSKTTTTPPIEQTLDNVVDSYNKINNRDKEKEKDKDKDEDIEKFKSVNSINSISQSNNITNNNYNNNETDNTAKEKLQNVFNINESPVSYKTSLEDNFDLKSKSSMTSSSRKTSRRRSFKNPNSQSEQSILQPLTKIDNNPPVAIPNPAPAPAQAPAPTTNTTNNTNSTNNTNNTNNDNKSVNQLRQITSRLFDSKVVQPRRYSDIDADFMDDSFEGDDDYYDISITNTNQSINNPTNIPTYNTFNQHTKHPNTTHPYDYYLTNGAEGYDDDLSNYFSTNFNPATSNNNHNNGNPNNLNYLNKQQILGNTFSIPDYGSIHTDNKQRLLRKRNDFYNSPHDFTSSRAQRLKQIKSFCYTISAIFLLLFLGFISGFILATNKELQNLKILEIGNTIVSQEELVFDMLFSAFNPGLMPITIDTVQLDIFAKTNSLFPEYTDGYSNTKTYETVLLGTIETLEVPLYFQGGFLNRRKDVSKTEIKIVNPCSYDDGDGDGDDDDDGNGSSNSTVIPTLNRIVTHSPDPRWLNISHNPFDLIVRGAMMYKLPFSAQNHTISISYTAYVDPGYEV